MKLHYIFLLEINQD